MEYKLKGAENMGQYTFPENLKRIRKERGLSQKMLADMLGISQASISYYELSVEYPTIDKVYDIARVLEVPVDELISAPQKLTKREIKEIKN